MITIKAIRNLVLATIVGLLTSGCASTAAKGALSNFNSSTRAFGQVVSTASDVRGFDKDDCKKAFVGTADAAKCNDLGEFDGAKVAILRLNRFVTTWVAVPKGLNLKERAVIELDPSKRGFGFIRVAAQQPTETCGWVGGRDMVAENGAGAVVRGFVMGALIVPGAIAMSSDDLNKGGIVCDGWTFESMIPKS